MLDAGSASDSSGQQRATAGPTCKHVDLALAVHRHSVVGRNARREVVRCQVNQCRHQLELADTCQQLFRNSHFALGEGRGRRKRQRQRQDEVTRHGLKLTLSTESFANQEFQFRRSGSAAHGGFGFFN